MFRLILFILLNHFITYALGKRADQGNYLPVKQSSSYFTTNKGQIRGLNGEARPDVLFKYHSKAMTVFVRQTGFSYMLPVSIQKLLLIDRKESLDDIVEYEMVHKQIDVNFVNANRATINKVLINEHEKIHLYNPNLVSGYALLNPAYRVVRQNLYPGIDLILEAKDQGMKYDLLVKSGASTDQIQLQWKGAKDLHIDENGHLTLSTESGQLIERIPEVYQRIDGNKINISAKYIWLDREQRIIGFEITDFNSSYDLVIDPWVTYYGGGGYDVVKSVAVDKGENVIFGGTTASLNNIAYGGFQGTLQGDFNGFIAKFTQSGNRIWATYFGGDRTDYIRALTVDSSDNIVVTGYTSSLNGIAYNAEQAVFGGSSDALVAKFSSTGERLWATYYGGAKSDIGQSVATNKQGDVFLAGYTGSDDLDAQNGFRNTIAASDQYDAFIVKFNAVGNRIWSTYYGGVQNEFCEDVVVDRQGDLYIVGSTLSDTDVAYKGYQNTRKGDMDAFIVKFNDQGDRLWASYFGEILGDYGASVDVDSKDNVYLVGRTYSRNNIAYNGVKSSMTGNDRLDAYIVKFDKNGLRLWSSYYGGTNRDYAYSVSVDRETDHPFMSGDTYSNDFPVSECALQTTLQGSENSFVVHLTDTGKLACASYFGMEHEEDAKIFVDGCYVYIVGYTPGSISATSGSHQDTAGGYNDGFVAQLYKNSCGVTTAPVQSFVDTSNNKLCYPNCDGKVEITIDPATACLNIGNFTYKLSNGEGLVNTTDTVVTFDSLCAGSYWLAITTYCEMIDTLFFDIKANDFAIFNFDLGEDTLICSGDTLLLVPGIIGYDYIWQNGSSGTTHEVTQEGLYILQLSKSNCYGTDSIYILIDTIGVELGNDTILCFGDSLVLVPNYMYDTAIWQQNVFADSFVVHEEGMYYLELRRDGCREVDSISIQIDSIEKFTLGEDDVLCEGDSTTILVPDNNLKWTWFDGSSDPMIAVYDTGYYSITGTSYCGDFVDSIYLKFERCYHCILFAPNAFTPSDHGQLNQTFNTYTECKIVEYEMRVYNRWGEQVFESFDPNVDWNGTYQSKPCQIGVYVYVLSVRFESGQLVHSRGNIHLIR